MNKFCCILILIMLGGSCLAQDSIMAVDSAFYETKVRNTAWTLEGEDLDGGTFLVHFKGDSISFFYMDFVRGFADGICTYSYVPKKDYFLVQMDNCPDPTQPRLALWIYFRDEDTMMLRVPENVKHIPTNSDANNWYLFSRFNMD
jgi:hypothetical protein